MKTWFSLELGKLTPHFSISQMISKAPEVWNQCQDMIISLTAWLLRGYSYWNFGQSYPMQLISVSVSWLFWGNHLLIIFPNPWDHKSHDNSHILLGMRKIQEPGGAPIVCIFCQLIAERILDRVGSMCKNKELFTSNLKNDCEISLCSGHMRNTKYYSLPSVVEIKKEI